MLTMHPTLLIGSADWDAERMPQAEFASRLAQLWECAPEAAGAIAYGDSREHAALAYLTHFTPKLEPAIALIPRNGAPKLMVGGGANMIPAAKPLTWITDLVPLRPTGKTIAQWLGAIGGPCIGIDCDNMPASMRREFDQGLAGRGIADATGAMQAIMQRKSTRELACIRAACDTLQASIAAAQEAQASGAGVTTVVLAAEHAAIKRHAQDVRTLFSIDGGRTLRPFSLPVDRVIDPLPLYIAVRQFGYWADGSVWLGATAEAAAGAKTLLAFIAAAKPGSAVPQGIEAIHIGLAMDAGSAATLDDGGVYSLRLGAASSRASAMIAVHGGGIETLWSSP